MPVVTRIVEVILQCKKEVNDKGAVFVLWGSVAKQLKGTINKLNACVRSARAARKRCPH
jgi:hypothetical protein